VPQLLAACGVWLGGIVARCSRAICRRKPILGLVLAAGFVLIETKVTPRPLVPFKIFRGEVGFVLASVGFG
jgi:hypothetical protein